MKKQMLVLAAAVASALALGSAPGAESVALTVDIAEVKQDVQAPVRGGVPFGRGKVASPDNIRALMDGREIDLQARKLASWPDGSVKWALLDFVAKNGDKVTVEFGPDVRRREPAKGIAASAEADAITVDSGSVRLVVRRSGTGFIDELAFDANGDGRYDAAETVFAASAPGERRNFLDFVHRPLDEHYATLGNFMPGGQAGPSGIEITELSLEEKGPMRAVILIRGRHKVARLASRVADQIKSF